MDVGDRTGYNAPAAPQAIARGRLPKPTIAATMNARITWMRPEGRRQWPYICAGVQLHSNLAREEGRVVL